LHAADVDLDRRARRLGPLGRGHAGEERNRDAHRPDGAGGTGQADRGPAGRVQGLRCGAHDTPAGEDFGRDRKNPALNAFGRAESRGLGGSLMTSLLEMVSGGIEKPLILAYCGATIKGAGGGGATAPARRLRWRLRRSFATVPPRVRDDAEAAVLRWRGGWA